MRRLLARMQKGIRFEDCEIGKSGKCSWFLLWFLDRKHETANFRKFTNLILMDNDYITSDISNILRNQAKFMKQINYLTILLTKSWLL